jgi:predicted enzyme related to lactoylglutathione lyase
MRWVTVAPRGAATELALIATPGQPPASCDTGIRFCVPDAQAEHDSMRRAGVTVGDVLRWDDVPAMFTFDDPDGNRFYVIEDPS